MPQLTLSELQNLVGEDTAAVASSNTLTSLEALESLQPVELSSEDQRDLEEEFGFFEGIDRDIQFTLGSTPQTFGKALVFFGDYVRENDDLSVFGVRAPFNAAPLGERILKTGLRLVAQNQETLQQKFPEKFANVDKFDVSSALTQGGVSLFSALGLAVIGGPILPAGVFGLHAAAEGFYEARSQGRSTDEAATIASLLGVVEGSLEFLGIDALFKSQGGILKRALKGYVTEFLQEGSQSLAGGTIRLASGLREYEGQETLVDIVTEAAFEAAIGGLLGGAASVPITVMQKQAVESGLKKLGVPQKEVKEVAREVMAKGMEDMVSIAEQIADAPVVVNPANKPVTSSTKPTKVEKTLDERLSEIEQKFVRPDTKARKEVKAVQEEVIRELRKSSLTPKNREKFIKAIKNLQTKKQFDAKFPDIKKRIVDLETKQTQSSLRDKIVKILKSGKLVKGGAKPKGKFVAEVQKLLTQLQQNINLTKAEAKLKLELNLRETFEKGPSAEKALENKVLALAAGFQEQTPQQLQELANELELLIQGGRDSRFRKDLEERLRRQELVDQTIDVITGKKEVSADRFDTLKEQAEKILKTSYVSLISWEDKLDLLSSLDDSKQDFSQLSEIANVRDAVRGEERGVQIAAEQVVFDAMQAFKVNSEKELFRQFKQDAKPIEIGRYINAFGDVVVLKYTKAELRKMAMEWRDSAIQGVYMTAKMSEDGKQLGMGFTQEMVDAINIQLTEEDVAFIDAQLAFYKNYYDGINEVYRDLYGVDLPRVENYSPIRREASTQLPVDEFLKEVDFRRSVSSTSFITRVKNFRPLRPASDIDVIQAHIAEMEHFKNWSHKVRDLNTVFGDANVRKTIEKLYGKKMMKSIDSHIIDFTRGGTDRSKLIGSLELFRRNFTISALAIKPALAVKQMVSFIAFAETIPTSEFIAGVTDFIAHPNEAKAILDQSSLVQNRGRNITRDIRDIATSESFAIFRKNPTFLNALMLMVRLGDKGAIYLGGWSVYRHALKQTGSHDQALKIFEETTKKTQQSPDIDELSDFQRGGSWARLFTMFTSSQNQYFRREVGAIRGLINGRVTPKEFTKKIAIYHFLLPMLFQWVVDFGRWNKDHQMRVAIMGSLNGIFILKDLLDAGILVLQGKKPFLSNTPINDVMNGVVASLEDVSAGDVMAAIEELSTSSVGPLTGMPIQQLFNIGEGIEDISKGQELEGVLKLMGWSPYIIDQNLNPVTGRRRRAKRKKKRKL